MTPTTTAAPARRRYDAYDIRLFDALRAGALAAATFLILYYATLGLLPWIFAYPITRFPVGAWAHRMDLAQFLGSLVHPPYPTPLNWGLGLALMAGTLISLAVVYAFLLSWVMQNSDTAKGLGFGLANGAGLLLFVTIANGLHPAIMRNALADTGLLMLGWSNWAPVQILLVHAVYGAILGRLYQPKYR